MIEYATRVLGTYPFLLFDASFRKSSRRCESRNELDFVREIFIHICITPTSLSREWIVRYR